MTVATTYPTAHTATVSNPRLKMLNALKTGSKAIMTFMAIPSTRMAQVVALCGFDVSVPSKLSLTPGSNHRL